MTKLRPFFSYYGGKWQSAPKYPAPRYGTLVEPFAGAAGYATRHHDRNVVLVDRYPVIAGLWQYLIDVKASEIRAIPSEVENVDDLRVAQEAKWLVGFWVNAGAASPRKRPSAWMRKGHMPGAYWGVSVRDRIAAQVEHIRHWRVVHGSYEAARVDGDATWFVDPPYANAAGRHYKFDSIDYDALGAWCRSRRGHVIACEGDGASWLPFRHLHINSGNNGKRKPLRSAEAIWTNDDHVAASVAA